MLRSVHITRYLSFLLLVVFAISITPKRFLHGVFAKHVDNKPGKYSNTTHQLSNAGFNCDNDNLVAESSFVSDQQTFSIPISPSLSAYIFQQISFSSAFGIYAPLRGPPVTI